MRSSHEGNKRPRKAKSLEVMPLDEPDSAGQNAPTPGNGAYGYNPYGGGGSPVMPVSETPPGPIPAGPYPAYPGQPYPAAPIPVQPYALGPAPVQPYPPGPVPVQPYAPGPVPMPSMMPGQPYAPGPMPVQPMAPGPIPIGPVPVQPGYPGPMPVQPAPVMPAPVMPTPVPTARPAPRPPEPVAPVQRAPAATPRPAPVPEPVVDKPEAAAPVGPKPLPISSGAARPILVPEEMKAAQKTSVVEDKGWELGRKPVGVMEEIEQREELGRWTLFWQNFVENHRSMLISLIVHLVALLGMAVWFFPTLVPHIVLYASMETPEEPEMQELEEIKLDNPEPGVVAPDIIDRLEPESLQPLIDMKNAAEGVDAGSVELSDFGLEKAPFNDVIVELGRGTGVADQIGTGKGKKGTGYGLNGDGMGMGGRGGRRGQAGKYGATPESEEAVDLALKWLADHQLADGGWNFNHGLAPTCNNQCANPGEMPEARIAATAFGVLPFLGAGQTHQVGKYQKTVSAGLYYLINNMKITKDGGSLMEPGGRMYAHGLATIALCEAYAMNMNPEALRKKKRAEYDGEGVPTYKEKKEDDAIVAVGNDLAGRLGPAAQLALNYVMYAQDPNGGGWRYEPRTPGDTSVVGWQLMALISGKLAYLRVDPRCFVLANTYLEHVKIDPYGSDYGYTDPQRGTQATQAIGLLSRMYLGWRRDNPGLSQGVDTMSGRGPNTSNMYYSYYATQVLHHFGGEKWKQWNEVMRDSLVASQNRAGHQTGSWFFGGGDMGASKGGRLYCTAMAAMTLEVYYRHMPIYGEAVFDQAQPQDANPEAPKEPDP